MIEMTLDAAKAGNGGLSMDSFKAAGTIETVAAAAVVGIGDETAAAEWS
jgi:hypothetical protein